MGDFLTNTVEWLTHLPALWAYAIILVIAFGENVLPPIPGDMIVVFGGYMVGIGRLDVVPVVLLSTIGGTLGFMAMYAIGHHIGSALLDPDRLNWLPKKRIGTVQEKLRKWGFGVVVANRFLSGLRSVISLTVGMAHMPVGKTWIYSTVSSLVWTTILAGAGYLVGDNWEIVSEYLRAYGWAIAGLIVLFIGYQFFSYLRNRSQHADENPDI